MRDGRSYVTRAVRAVQRGRTIFTMMCSFQIPEPRQPTFQFSMPHDVPAPDACDSIDSVYRKALDEEADEKLKGFWRTTLEVSIVVRKARMSLRCSARLTPSAFYSYAYRSAHGAPSR